MIRRGTLRDAAGNVWYARLLLAAAASFGLYFAHAVGLESLDYTGVVRETELLVWLSVAAFGVACYCWYRGSRAPRRKNPLP